MRDMYQQYKIDESSPGTDAVIDSQTSRNFKAAGRQLLVWCLALEHMASPDVLRGYYSQQTETKYIGIFYELGILLDCPL